MPTDDPDPGVEYAVDADDRLTSVSPGWDGFAARGLAPHLAGSAVLGRSLWDFVSCDSTRSVYRDLLWRVRSGKAVEFTFRCDSPCRRREMRMTMSPLGAGGVLFRTALLSRVSAPARLWDAAAPRDGPAVRSCAWCKRIDVGGRWVEVEDAVDALGLMDRPDPPPVTHGICRPCLDRMEAVCGD